MSRYFAIVISGLQEVAARELKADYADVAIHSVLDGFVNFSTSAPVKRVGQTPYFSNVYQEIVRLRNASTEPAREIHALLKPATWRGLGVARTFRIIFSDQGQLKPIRPKDLEAMESTVSALSGSKVHRSLPQSELWIIRREDGTVVFGLRLSRRKDLQKTLLRGELRPDLVEVMCRLAEPKANELFLDPFCGSGAIPLARAQRSPRCLVLASDSDPEAIATVTARVKDLGLKRQVVVRQGDARHLDRYADGSIDRIVTDPPWGEYKAIPDRELFYGEFLDELARILKPGGILVLLGPRRSDGIVPVARVEALGLTLRESYDLLVSGRKATLYKFTRPAPADVAG